MSAHDPQVVSPEMVSPAAGARSVPARCAAGVTAHVAADSRYDLAALAVSLVGLLMALVFSALHRVGNFGVESDFYATYAVQAANLLAGKSYTYPFHPPGYSMLVAVVSCLTRDMFLAGKLISACSFALFGWLTYSLIKALFDARVAFATMVLTIASLLPASFLAATDLLGAVTMLLPLWVLLRRPQLTVGRCIAAGLLAGLAYLVRTNGLAVVIGIGFLLPLLNINRETIGRRIARVGLFACGVLLVLAPWWIANGRTSGSPAAGANYLQVAAHFYGSIPDSQGISLYQAAAEFHSPWEVLSRDPLHLLVHNVWDLLYRYPDRIATDVLRFPASTLAGAGFLLLLTALSSRRLVFLGVCGLGYLLLGLVGFQLRFYYFLFPVLFLSVVYVLFQQDVSRALGAIGRAGSAVSWLVVLILAGVLALHAFRASRNAIRSEPRYLLAMAQVLRDRSSPEDMVIAQKPHLAYLAGLKHVFPLADTADEFLAAAHELGARYIIYSDLEAGHWPGLRSLRDPALLPDSFHVIARHEPSHTLIYEVAGLVMHPASADEVRR